MMKEGIRGLRPSYKQDKQSALRTSVRGAQAAIEFKIFELEQTPCMIFHANWYGRQATPQRTKLCRSGVLAALGRYQRTLVRCEGAAPTKTSGVVSR